MSSTDRGPGSRRNPGRPRDPQVERRVLDAAVSILEESGLAAVTMRAVAERAGVARATVYLRWPTRAALVGATARAAAGGVPFPLTGDLNADLLRGTTFVRDVLAGRHFVAALPELLAAILGGSSEITYDVLAPNRAAFAQTYPAAAAAQGFDDALDSALAFDLLLGAQLNYLFANRAAPSPEYARQVAEVIIRGLRPTVAPDPAAIGDR